MASWFKDLSTKAAQAAQGIVQQVESHLPPEDQRVDKKLVGVFAGLGQKLESTMNSAGHEQSAEDGQNLDTAEDAPPWTLSQPSLKPGEADLKKLVLAITEGSDEEVVERLQQEPPPETDFDFDFEKEAKRAIAALEHDPRLQKVRFTLVPSVIKEPTFWRNYFYMIEQLRRDFTLRYASSSSARPAADESRYADASDNIDEFASEDALHVSMKEDEAVSALRSELGIDESQEDGDAVAVEEAENGDLEDWELEMRKELDFDGDADNADVPLNDDDIAKLGEDFGAEMNFDS